MKKLVLRSFAVVILAGAAAAWWFLEKRASSVTGVKAVDPVHYLVGQPFIDAKLADLTTVLQTARAVPYLSPQTSTFTGFLLTSMEPESPLRELGLRDGDIVTEINGLKMSDAGKGLEAFMAMKGRTETRVKLLRDGTSIEILYEVR